MTDLTVATIKEEYGKWMVEFNWSDMDEYDRSIAHGDSTSGKTAIHTDTLTLASSLGAQMVVSKMPEPSPVKPGFPCH